MDMRTLKNLIHLITVSEVDEIEVAEQDQKFRVVKATPKVPAWQRWPDSLPALEHVLGPSPVLRQPAAEAQAPQTAQPLVPRATPVQQPDSHSPRSSASVVAPPASTTALAATPACKPAARHVVTSPIVGRFYAGTGPAAKLGIKLGTHVREGEPLCVVEALKIPNRIKAGRSGKIAEILCENGQAVEYGQPLLVIE